MQILLFLLAISVKQDGTRLRSGCSPDDTTVATVAAGSEVTIRYAISGESKPCYKVAVRSGGNDLQGYLSGDEIAGLESFDQARRQAARVDLNQALEAIRPSASPAAAVTGSPANRKAAEAQELIQAGQPARALEVLGPQLRSGNDPGVLALAGVAAWKGDDLKLALEYWRRSLEIQPNPELESLVHRVEREAQADQSGNRLVGMRVVLRYDGVAIQADTARQMLATLDDEYFRISQQLGCFAEEKIVAVVQTRQAYRTGTNAAEWSGGQFDGRIHVPVLNGQAMDDNMRRVFAHETVHACVAMLGTWPVWLHEGLAQKYSGDSLSPAARQKIAQMIAAHELPKLENLGQSWSAMDTAHAAAAYAVALAAVESLAEDPSAVRNLLRNPSRLSAVSADLDKRLGL
jgi:tetratricopeptide (TPR) repeat protein